MSNPDGEDPGPGSRIAARIAECLEQWFRAFPEHDFGHTLELITRTTPGERMGEEEDYFLFRASPRSGLPAHELSISRVFLGLTSSLELGPRLLNGIARARMNAGTRFLIEGRWMFAHEIPRRAS